MARFEIKSKDGNSIRYSGKPRYNGSYLKPAFIEFSEISSPTPIAWEVGDYLDYSRTGMRYYLYSIPQPSKKARSGANGGSFTYSNVQLFSATKDLEIALFRDLVSNDNNIHFSTSPDVATFENVEGIARRIQACLDDLYPGKWEIRLAEFSADEDAELIESISTAKDFALSGGTCLDALSKIYELWDNLGWIHSYENGKEVITIGYANKRIDANTTDSYLYGKGNGLTAIKKNQTNKDEFATRLYVYGSERNLPARYYNDKEILNAESVDIRNLMLPLDSWGKTDGLPDARKAYLENAEAVAKFGVIPKTHYFDSEDAGADIYPTIERLTIGEIRSVMQSTDEYYPTDRYADEDRADAVSGAENPTDDGVINPNGKEYDAKSYLSIQSHDKTINMVGGLQASPLLTDYLLFSKVVVADIERAKVVIDLSETITIPDRGFTSVSAKLMIGDDEQAGYGTAVGSTTLVGVKSEDGKNWEIKLGRISAEYGKSELYDNTGYHIYGHISITANTIGVESGEITIKFGPGSGSIGLKRILDKTFRLNLRQIGFNINDQAALGNGKTISMKTGACAGRNFVISGCTYSSALDAWTITCKRQQDDTLGMLFPNNSYEIAEGDTFVLLDIAMPELYVSVAQNRLLAEGQKLLSRASKIQSNYEPSIDAKVMVESGRNLREGMFMEISDEDVVDGTTDYILIDSLSIYEDESAIPTYKVTLREKKKVSYKGTPSATSANDTKSVEDETEEQQVNVDLTGYAKETYVDEKVSEVKNALDAIWSLDENGNLVTEKQVIVKNNIIISGDTSTEGTGQDVPSGIDEAQLKEYLDTNKYITSDYAYSKEEVNRLIDEVNAGDIDLTNYYTKEETASEISNAIAGIEIPSLDGYAKLTDIPSLDGYATEQFVTDSITALNVGQYATKTALETLQGEVDNIEAVLGMDEEAEGIINTWNEVKAFLAEIEVGDDLASILEGINTRIGNNTTAIGLIDGRVTVNEAAISDNATNIRNAKGEIDGLKDNKADWGTTLAHYGITDAYTKAEVAAELAKYLLLESANQTIKGNITIEGNLIVTGDTASGARGTNSGTDGTLIGVIVNGTRYEDETNGMLDLSSLMNQYALATEIPSLEGYAKLTDIPTTMAWTAITGKPSFASVATSGSYNDLSNKPTIPTTLPASDVYAWAKAATKPSYKTSEVAEETNLYFTNARAVSALADTLKDYVTKTALASDLGEYASKEWVNEKGYITGISSSMIASALGSVNNGGKVLSSTGGGLGWISLPTSLPASDVYAWAKKSSLALADVPDLSSKYLSVNGGKLESARTDVLTLNSKSDSTLGVYLRMEHNAVKVGEFGCGYGLGTYMLNGDNYLAVKDNGKPYYNANLILHEGNYSSYALPRSGGTIEAAKTRPLVINSTSSDKAVELRLQKNGVLKADIGHDDSHGVYIYDAISTRFMGINTDGTPYYHNGSYKDTLIHSGNIGSQFVEGIGTAYANQDINFDKEGKVRMIYGTASNSVDLGYPFRYASGLSVVSQYAGWQMVAYGSNTDMSPRFRMMSDKGIWYAWKTIAFTDSDITGNAGSASNVMVNYLYNRDEDFPLLMTAPDAVGVAANNYVATDFNGKLTYHQKSGTLKNGGNIEINMTSALERQVLVKNTAGSTSLGTTTSGDSYVFANKALSLFAGEEKAMFINQLGNVTIGASDSAGTTYKLYVDGSIKATTVSARALINYESGGYGCYIGDGYYSVGTAEHGACVYTYGARPVYFYTNGSEKMRIAGNGNVLIGTTTDNGAKLDVNGTARVGNNTAGGELLRFNMDRPWTFYQQNSGAGSNLALIASTQNKAFFIQNSAAQNLIGFYAYDTPYVNIISRAVLDKTLDVAGAVTMSSSLSVFEKITLSSGDQINGKAGIAINYASGSQVSTSIWDGAGTRIALFNTDRSSNFYGAVTMSSTLSVGGNTTINGNVLIGSSTDYGAKQYIYGKADVFNALTIANDWYGGSGEKYTDIKLISYPSNSRGGYIRVGINAAYGHFSSMSFGSMSSSSSLTELVKITNSGTTIYGNLVVAGDTSSTSDMRLKNRLEDVTLSLKTMAEMPLFTFKWKNGQDDRIHLGSSAQYWEEHRGELVFGEDTKTLNYAVLGVAGIKSLAVKTLDHESRIKELEDKVEQLQNENRRLRYGG